MVALGGVDELRAGAQGRLVVTAPQAPPGWAAGIAGVTVESENRGTATLSLTPGADDQAVLAAALDTGPVTEFAWRRPTLTELFRHVVSTEVAA
jgi:ABC-2 type transport system ATP-binding protein